MKKNIILILCLLSTATALPLSSCHSFEDNRPDLVKEQLLAKITKESNGALGILSFTKTNGMEQSINGLQVYTLEFNYTLTALVDCYKNGNPFMGYFHDFYVARSLPTDGWGKSEWSNALHCPQGWQTILKGQATLIKKENGWEVDNIDIQ